MPVPIQNIKKRVIGTAITTPDDSKRDPIISTNAIQKKVWSEIINRPATYPKGESHPVALNPRVI